MVLHRVAHPTYPNTICGVVYQGSERRTGCQFSFTCDGVLARTPSRFGWNRARAVASAALAGSVYAPVGLARAYAEGLQQAAATGAASQSGYAPSGYSGPSYAAPAYSAQAIERGGDTQYAGERLPGAGSVKSEFARSGQWIGTPR